MRIITGRWRGHKIRAPGGRDVRPTADRVKEAWMSMLGGRVVGARVLDLFAGSGSLGLECLSRGARNVSFVERSGPVLDILRSNVRKLGPDEGEVRIVRSDAMAYLERLTAERAGAVGGTADGAAGEAADRFDFDIALADPPYGKGLAARVLETFHDSPFAAELWVEHGSKEILPDLAGLESRRYGDTILTRLTAAPPGAREP